MKAEAQEQQSHDLVIHLALIFSSLFWSDSTAPVRGSLFHHLSCPRAATLLWVVPTPTTITCITGGGSHWACCKSKTCLPAPPSSTKFFMMHSTWCLRHHCLDIWIQHLLTPKSFLFAEIGNSPVARNIRKPGHGPWKMPPLGLQPFRSGMNISGQLFSRSISLHWPWFRDTLLSSSSLSSHFWRDNAQLFLKLIDQTLKHTKESFER